jgi:hypothetical protein
MPTLVLATSSNPGTAQWLDSSLLPTGSALKFMGTWDAFTNDPDIGTIATDAGQSWVVSDAGTTALPGPNGPITDWQVDDWAVYDGAGIWYKLDNSSWDTTGNTVTGSQFIGSVNDADVVLKRNNIEQLRIVSTGVALSSTPANSIIYQGGNRLLHTVGGVALGSFAGNLATTGNSNVAIGNFAMFSSTTSDQCVMIGSQAGQNASGDNNVGVGPSALGSVSGLFNTAVGDTALNTLTSGERNTAVGGYTGLTITTGSRNTLLGMSTNVDSGAAFNRTAVGALVRVDADNALVLGSINGINGAATDTSVGIGTTAPATKLHLANGDLRLSNSNNTAGRIQFFEPSGSGTESTSIRAGGQTASIDYRLPFSPPTYGMMECVTAGGTDYNMQWREVRIFNNINFGVTANTSAAFDFSTFPYDTQYYSGPTGNLTGVVSVGDIVTVGIVSGWLLKPNDVVLTAYIVDIGGIRRIAVIAYRPSGITAVAQNITLNFRVTAA